MVKVMNVIGPILGAIAGIIFAIGLLVVVHTIFGL